MVKKVVSINNTNEISYQEWNFLEFISHYIFELYLASPVGEKHFSQTGTRHEMMHECLQCDSEVQTQCGEAVFSAQRCRKGTKTHHLWDTEDPRAKAFIFVALTN